MISPRIAAAVRLAAGGWIGLALLALLVVCLPASAQGPDLQIEQATLSLWPEYDDPGLLVLFSGTFSDSAAFPQTVRFPLAQGARDIQATVQEASGLINQQWDKNGDELTYTLPKPGFHVENYVDRAPSGSQREWSYTFKAPYPIAHLEVNIQEPSRATGFSVSPSAAASTQGADGFTYNTIRRENVAAGERIPITIRYTKTDQGFSRAPAQAARSAAASPSSSSRPVSQSTPWLPFLLIGMGIVGLVSAGVYWLVLQRRSQPAPARPPTRKATAASSPAAQAGGGAVFCTQCGRQLGPADRFCATCGAPRRN